MQSYIRVSFKKQREVFWVGVALRKGERLRQLLFAKAT